MTTRAEHDALMSPRVAADLCGVPVRLVLALIRSGSVKTVPIRGQRYVSLAEVEHSIREGKHARA